MGNNEGPFAVLIYHEAQGVDYKAGSNSASLQYPGKSMTVYFNDCSFISNDVTDGVIVNIGGTLSMTRSFFQRNQNTTIHCRGKDSRLTMYDSCFVENDSNLPGAVILTDEAEMLVN